MVVQQNIQLTAFQELGANVSAGILQDTDNPVNSFSSIFQI